jgi:hypothetical protein
MSDGLLQRPDNLTELGSAGDVEAAETRPPGADRYATWWKVWLPIPILLLLLDVTFNAWFWRIPKLTGSAADYTYQYLYDLQNLRGTKEPATTRVVVFGSSVSSAFDPWQVQSLLAAHGQGGKIEVRRLTKPGSKPSDHRLVWQAELDAIKPDIAVIVFNLVDFLNPSFERDLKPDIRYILPPWAALTRRWKYIPTVAEKVELVTASASNLYRFRKPLQSALEDHAKTLWRWARSGPPAGGYGWYADGYTADRFGMPIAAGERFEYYVHPAWIAQRGTIHLRFTLDDELIAERDETEPGWKTLPVAAERGGFLQMTADSVWSPRAAGERDDTRLLAVRLRTAPPEGLNHGRAPFRYELRTPSEPDRFLRMGDATGEAYRQKWLATLEANDEFARRFRAYRDVKLALRGRRFEPVGEFAELKRMVGELSAAGVMVVMVNTPESPLLEGLDASPYYRDYLQFFREVARDTPGVRFIDLHDALPAEDLNDWHHVNFVGQIKLGPVFAGALSEAIEARHARGGRGRDAL